MNILQQERNRRLKQVSGLFCFFLCLILVRLFQLQVDQKFFLAKKAMQQYIHSERVMPMRGVFYDRQGKPLVFNEGCWDVAFIPFKNTDQRTKAFLTQFFDTKKDEHSFIWIKRGIQTQEKDALVLQAPGLTVFPSFRRTYLYPHCNHLLGFVDIDNNGLAGLELSCNSVLKGEEGFLKGFKNGKNKGAFFEHLQEKKVIDGESVLLTIDESLQRILYETLVAKISELEALQGAAILLDPTSGQVLSMVSYPNFDPMHLSKESLEAAHNIPVEAAFEAGSVCKVFLALAGLDEKVVTPDTEIDCQGRQAKIGGILVQHPASLGSAMGIVPFSQVIQKSNNIGVAKVGFELGSRLYDQYKKMGLGQKTMIELPAEQAGTLRPPKKWSVPTPVALSFGYEVSVTLLQIAQVFSMIANDGCVVPPTLLSTHQKKEPKRIYDAALIQDLKGILEPIGKLCKVEGYRIFGKTGTARLIKEGEYSNKHHLYTFAGIVEKDQYKRVLVTMIKEPKNPHLLAAQVTAPLFKEMVERIVLVDQQESPLF